MTGRPRTPSCSGCTVCLSKPAVATIFPSRAHWPEQAVKTAPSPHWAGRAVLEFRCASGDWSGAPETLDGNYRSGILDRVVYRRQRAVLLTARARALVDQDRDSAKAAVFEAVKLAPDLVPAAALAGRFYVDAGDTRRAARTIEAAWRVNPHPDLAEVYVNLKPGDSAREAAGARGEALRPGAGKCRRRAGARPRSDRCAVLRRGADGAFAVAGRADAARCGADGGA